MLIKFGVDSRPSIINKDKGFTLIELLVVISIIGMLSSIVLASLSTVRAKARDATRLNDLTQIRNALELYAADNGGKYPLNLTLAGGVTSGVETRFVGTGPTSCQLFTNQNIRKGLDTLVAQQYIGKIPQDPLAGTTQCYMYTATPNDYGTDLNNAYGVSYKFRVYNTVETIDVIDTDHTFRDPVSIQSACPSNYNSSPNVVNIYRKTFAIYSPGAECL